MAPPGIPRPGTPGFAGGGAASQASPASAEAGSRPASELLIARYGELWLKGRNRSWFERLLERNLRAALRPVAPCRIERGHGQITVVPSGRAGEVARRMQEVFGISTISPSYPVERDPDAIARLAGTVLRGALEEGHPGAQRVRFRVETRRGDKRYPMTSTELDRHVADRLPEELFDRLKVDLGNPELVLSIRVRAERAYVSASTLPGAGGLPVGSLGRALCLISGGIDSPVAAWLAMKRGCEVSFVTFHSYPYVGQATLDKVRKLAQSLLRFQRRTRLLCAPFTEIQTAIRDRCEESYRTVLYRRMMHRIAGRLARAERARALVTGDSLGQVASQTLENLDLFREVTDLPLLQPLITSDKAETIALARRIGTYDLSIVREPDCCTVFQPSRPVIRGRRDRCEANEAKLDVERLVDAAVEGTEPVEL